MSRRKRGAVVGEVERVFNRIVWQKRVVRPPLREKKQLALLTVALLSATALTGFIG